MKKVSVPMLVFVGLLALAYWAGRRGFGSGIAAQVGVGVKSGASE